MTFDRWDICEAYYVYAALWGHDDFTRSIVRRLNRIKYTPGQGRDAGTVRSLSANGRDIFTGLVAKHHSTVSGYVHCECCWSECIGTIVRGRFDTSAGADLCLACEAAGCSCGGECQVEHAECSEGCDA
jgi:hypothetical protein